MPYKTVEGQRDHDAKRYQVALDLIEGCKEDGCKICGELRPYVLVFHHRDPSLKKFTISEGKFRNLKVVAEEIAKCDVLCCNCHAELHYNLWQKVKSK